MLKQKYTINLSITKENLTKGSSIYAAKEIIQQLETVGNHDPNTVLNVEKEVAEIEVISVVSVMSYILLSFQLLFQTDNLRCMFLQNTQNEPKATETPDTGKSTNMKTRARKQMEPVHFNAENISGENKLKNIKLEKVCNEIQVI